MVLNHNFVVAPAVTAPLAGFYIKQQPVTYRNNTRQLEFTKTYWKTVWLGRKGRLGPALWR